jgi:UDP-N-acetylmuramate--alanine ligase
LFAEFTRAFYQSDVLFVMPIYAASEQPIAGVNAALLCDGIKAHGHKDVRCVSGPEEVVQLLEGVLAPEDVLLTLGAGDVWKIGEQVLTEKT